MASCVTCGDELHPERAERVTQILLAVTSGGKR